MREEKVLIAGSDPDFRRSVRCGLSGKFEVFEASDRDETVRAAKSRKPGAVLVDLSISGDTGGDPSAIEGLAGLVDELHGLDPLVKLILVTRSGGASDIPIDALGAEPYDFFTKPVDPIELSVIIGRALRRRGLEKERLARGMGLAGKATGKLVGDSPPMEAVRSKIRKVAEADVPVLLLGESGTGKELAASAIHAASSRANHPFITINCGAIPEKLIESELFGYERGAFTGAESRKRGKIEYAHKGTLFLDEIGELDRTLQVKLLRFLQNGICERIGGRTPVPVDVRVIGATNRDLEAMISDGSFREDLYFRLAVVTLDMPPLRERGEDVFTLATAFLKKYSLAYGKPVEGFGPETLAAMGDYGWPGNVRELENTVRRGIILARGTMITTEDLQIPGNGAGGDTFRADGFHTARSAFERKMICESLLRNRGRVGKTAEDLGITRQYLTRLLKKHSISKGLY